MIEEFKCEDGKYYYYNDTRYYYFKENDEWICKSTDGSYEDVVEEGTFRRMLESFIRKQKLEKLLGKQS